MPNSKLFQTIQKKLRLRSVMLREFMAEFLGTFMLMAFGAGSVAQSVLTGTVNGDFFSINWGWGLGVMLGVMVSGGVSGGHINPAVTVALAVFGKHPWVKVPVYLVAQYLGAFLASAVVFAVYLNALDGFEADRSLTTAGIFATYPGTITTDGGVVVPGFLSAGNGFGDQVVGTMMLLIAVAAITDKRNMEVPKGLIPFLVGLTVLAIGICFGFNSGYAINPARDLSPRLFTLLAGWGSAPFTATTVDGVVWWWIPVVAPHIGGILGVLIYVTLVELHYPEQDDFNLPQGHVHDAVATGTPRVKVRR